MKTLKWTTIVFLCAVLSGCNFNDLAGLMKDKSVQETSAAEVDPKYIVVDDVDLAKIILKPKHRPMKVTQDPFAPLFVGSEDDPRIARDGLRDEDLTKDILFLGLVNMGDEPFALIKVENVNTVYRINDQIKNMVIAEIQQDHILLKMDTRMIKLNRGDK